MSNLDDLNPTAMDDDSNDANDSLAPTEGGTKASRKEEEEEEEMVEEESNLQLMGVDQAVLHSIEKCGLYLSTNFCTFSRLLGILWLYEKGRCLSVYF